MTPSDAMRSDGDPEEAPVFVHRLRVRYNECDSLLIVFNANWYVYFDVAVTEFWRDLIGGYTMLSEPYGVDTVVAENGARFRGPARMDDEIDLALRIARIGNSSLRLEIDATRDGDLLCEGFLEYVFVDRATFAPRPIPDPVREALSAAGGISASD